MQLRYMALLLVSLIGVQIVFAKISIKAVYCASQEGQGKMVEIVPDTFSKHERYLVPDSMVKIIFSGSLDGVSFIDCNNTRINPLYTDTDNSVTFGKRGAFSVVLPEETVRFDVDSLTDSARIITPNPLLERPVDIEIKGLPACPVAVQLINRHPYRSPISAETIQQPAGSILFRVSLNMQPKEFLLRLFSDKHPCPFLKTEKLSDGSVRLVPSHLRDLPLHQIPLGIPSSWIKFKDEKSKTLSVLGYGDKRKFSIDPENKLFLRRLRSALKNEPGVPVICPDGHRIGFLKNESSKEDAFTILNTDPQIDVTQKIHPLALLGGNTDGKIDTLVIGPIFVPPPLTTQIDMNRRAGDSLILADRKFLFSGCREL